MTQTTEQRAQGVPESVDPRAASEVFYDGACPLCRQEIAVYQRMAGADPTSPLADAAAWRDVAGHAAARAPEADQAQLLARFHARRSDGRLVSGARAFIAVWRATPRLARMGRALDRQPFIALGDAAYWMFLKIRPLWRRRGGSSDRPLRAHRQLR